MPDYHAQVLFRPVSEWVGRKETVAFLSVSSDPAPMDASSYPLPFELNRSQLEGVC
jgi:hypothetical protein